jgi:hypothetical protein
MKNVFNLQHADSFVRKSPETHKNAATDNGFCLPVFLNMALVLTRGTSRDKHWGHGVADDGLDAQ